MLPYVSLTFFAPDLFFFPPLLMNAMWTLLVWLHFDLCPIPFWICLSSTIDFWFDLSLPSPNSCKLCILCWINISDLQLLCSQKSASGSLSLRPLWHKTRRRRRPLCKSTVWWCNLDQGIYKELQYVHTRARTPASLCGLPLAPFRSPLTRDGADISGRLVN